MTRPEEGVGPWVFRRGVHSQEPAEEALEGPDATVKRAFELVQSVKGEPPIGMPNLLPPVQVVFN